MNECRCAADYPNVKQGDGCCLAVTLYFNGDKITANELPLLDRIEYCFEDREPREISAAESFCAPLGQFLLPVSQEQTLDLEQGKTTLDVRVRFLGGDVLGAREKARVRVADANSEEVLT